MVVALNKELYCVLLCFSLHSVVPAFDSFCYPAFTYEILYLFIEIKKKKIGFKQHNCLFKLYWFKNLRKLIRTIKKSLLQVPGIAFTPSPLLDLF